MITAIDIGRVNMMVTTENKTYESPDGILYVSIRVLNGDDCVETGVVCVDSHGRVETGVVGVDGGAAGIGVVGVDTDETQSVSDNTNVPRDKSIIPGRLIASRMKVRSSVVEEI